jgi:lipoate synthase
LSEVAIGFIYYMIGENFIRDYKITLKSLLRINKSYSISLKKGISKGLGEDKKIVVTLTIDIRTGDDRYSVITKNSYLQRLLAKFNKPNKGYTKLRYIMKK